MEPGSPPTFDRQLTITNDTVRHSCIRTASVPAIHSHIMPQILIESLCASVCPQRGRRMWPARRAHGRDCAAGPVSTRLPCRGRRPGGSLRTSYRTSVRLRTSPDIGACPGVTVRAACPEKKPGRAWPVGPGRARSVRRVRLVTAGRGPRICGQPRCSTSSSS
jgi:hypothetical protein